MEFVNRKIALELKFNRCEVEFTGRILGGYTQPCAIRHERKPLA
jgi:hypothetical protein